MYSESATQAQIERVEQQAGLKLYRHTPADSRAVADHLKTAIDDQGKPTRTLRTEEHAFIRNERVLCQLDFSYATRYFTQISDGGGLFYLDTLWESQKLLLARLAQLEERNLAQVARKEACDGMLIADHKGGRQLGHTAISRCLIWHRTLFYPYTRTASVSVDEPGITGVFSKDELLYEHLPWWLKPELRYKSKDAHFKFEPFGSSVTYYQAQQRSGVGTGIGTGQTFDVSHMTEVSMYAYPQMLEKDFFPTIPQNPYSLCLLETTAFYRGGWWFEFSEAVRRGRKPRWSYLFIPFYAEPSKYRRTPPEKWEPNAHTLAMAATVERTSPEFMNGQTVRLGKEQLYWWESSYAEAQEGNSLNAFLGNYACVAGNTRISTEDGIKPIEVASRTTSVESGPVTRWHANGVKQTYTLETAWGRRLMTTADHLIFLSDGSCKAVADLKAGDELQLAPPKFTNTYQTVQWSPIRCQTNSIKIDENMGRFLGYYMGDGSYYNNCVNIACTAKDVDVVCDVHSLMALIIGRSNDPETPSGIGCTNVRTSSIHWKPFLKVLGAIRRYEYTYETNKQYSGWDNKGGWTRNVCVPQAIFDSPKSVIKEFLSGLFEADAHAYNYWQRVSLSGAYRGFIADVQLLLLGFGINSKITVTSTKPKPTSDKHFTAHLLSLGANAAEMFHRDIGFVSKRKQGAYIAVKDRPKPRFSGRRLPNVMLDTVKSVVPAAMLPVYDLTVEGSHRYGANGILVHNCTVEQSFQHAGQSAFPLQLLDDLRMRASGGIPYAVEVA